MTDANSNSGFSLGRRLIRASCAVGIAHIIFKLIGLIQAIVVGRYLDSGTYDVVYAFAFEGVIFSVFLLGEETIGPSFLPVFLQQKDKGGEKSAWHFANIILTVQFLILLLGMLLILVFPDAVIRLLTGWTGTNDPARYALARKSVIWLAPALICLSLGSTTYMILNGYKRFFLAAFGDASWKICVLASVLVGMGIFGLDYRCIIFGLLVGSIAKLLTHLAGMLREIRFFRPSIMFRDPAVKQMLLLMAPLILGVIFARARDIFNNVTILSYLDTEGLMKANSFGRKLYVAIGWLVPYSISIAMFPFFCELVDRNDKERFGHLLSKAGRMMLSVFIPFSFVCAVLSRPLSFVLFHGGEFTAEPVEWTAVSMSCYILVLPGYALEYLLMQAFFANRRMVSVTVVGIIFSAVSVAISYVGIAMFGARGVWALMVIALGYTLSRTLKAVTLVTLLKKSIPIFPLGETISFVLRAFLVGAISAGLCFLCTTGFERYISSTDEKLILLCKLAAGGVAALIGFLVSTRILRLKEPMDMWQWATDVVRKRFKRELTE
ncbi:murein biosynthesis integral membrane protein MurJ [Verrucomicrobiota bacterium]